MEFILGLILSWPAMIILIIFALGFEHNEAHGWTVIATLILGTIAYHVFGLSWMQVGILAAVWIPIGIVWSFWRWKRHVTRAVDSYDPDASFGYDATRDKIDPSNNINIITYWIIAWPFSFVEMLLGDIIDVIQVMVKKFFHGTYAKIATKGLADLEAKRK